MLNFFRRLYMGGSLWYTFTPICIKTIQTFIYVSWIIAAMETLTLNNSFYKNHIEFEDLRIFLWLKYIIYIVFNYIFTIKYLSTLFSILLLTKIFLWKDGSLWYFRMIIFYCKDLTMKGQLCDERTNLKKKFIINTIILWEGFSFTSPRFPVVLWIFFFF